MPQHVLGKCLLTACFIFMLCPRRTRFKLTRDHKFYNPMKRQSSVVLMKKVERNGDEIARIEASEPGFDLTEEEIIKFKIWPQGIIPYYIDEYSFDKVLRDRIRSFLDEVYSISGLHFLELPRPPDDGKRRWVFFINRRGLLDCTDNSLMNFTNEGVQRVVLGYDCITTNGELAEVVLALAGVPPQHNAPNRDLYVKIKFKNIIPEKQYLFQRLTNQEWLFHDVEYDYASAGHYNFHKYTINGKATLRPLRPINTTVGEGKGFSYSDIWKIRMLYNYISKKKRKSAKLPQCYKLFEPGTNFSRFQPEDEDETEPRNKPMEYLHQTKDKVLDLGNEKNNQSDSSEDEEKSKEKSEEISNKGSDEENKMENDEKEPSQKEPNLQQQSSEGKDDLIMTNENNTDEDVDKNDENRVEQNDSKNLNKYHKEKQSLHFDKLTKYEKNNEIIKDLLNGADYNTKEAFDYRIKNLHNQKQQKLKFTRPT